MLQRLRSWLPAAEPDQLRCPQCLNHVAFGLAACSRCGRPTPPIFDVPERPRRLALTHRQRQRLRLSALLVAFGPLALWMGLGLVFFIKAQEWENFPVFALAGLLMLLAGIPAALRFWGDAAGEALLQRAYLLDLIAVKRRSSHAAGSSTSYYAAFSQFGRFEVPKVEFDRLKIGARYQLAYSPRSNKLWSCRID